MLDPELIAPERPRRLKRVEFEKLVELGVFDDERVELLHGVIVEMTPTSPQHDSPIMRLTMLLVPPLVGRAMVRVNQGLYGDDESEPVPDLAIVSDGPWSTEHPAKAHLVIEVANSSFRKDRLVKAPLYAASQVEEYWIVDTRERNILVFRNSKGRTYESETRYAVGESVELLAFPDMRVAVADVFA